MLTKALFKEYKINLRGLRILRTKLNRIRILVIRLTKHICESSKVSGYRYFMLFLFFKVTNMNTAGIICSCDIHKRIRRENVKEL